MLVVIILSTALFWDRNISYFLSRCVWLQIISSTLGKFAPYHCQDIEAKRCFYTRLNPESRGCSHVFLLDNATVLVNSCVGLGRLADGLWEHRWEKGNHSKFLSRNAQMKCGKSFIFLNFWHNCGFQDQKGLLVTLCLRYDNLSLRM